MIYAANFKTNHTRATTKAYVDALEGKLDSLHASDSVYLFPPLTALDVYEGDFTVGVQNAYPTKNGAVTGEIGVEQLDEFGIRTVLIGHSERRELLGETKEEGAQKFAFFKSEGFEILYCIGEPLEVRKQGDEAVKAYLLAQFEGIDIEYENLMVAYEPIWAIGTGVSATVEQIASTHAMLKSLKSMRNKPLLYGGSVKPENIAEIRAIEDVDGVLVGSASLTVESFSALF
jgi:triosephosphate isomerase